MSQRNERTSLAEKLDHHVDEEGKILAEYRLLAADLGDTALGNLVSHILTEEELHHLLLRTMSDWLRNPAAQSHALPPQARRSDLLCLTEKLQRHEQDTIDACAGLQTRLDEQGERLLVTLLDAMILDSEKHRRLLVAVENMLKG